MDREANNLLRFTECVDGTKAYTTTNAVGWAAVVMIIWWNLHPFRRPNGRVKNNYDWGIDLAGMVQV